MMNEDLLQCFRPNHKIIDASGNAISASKINGKLYPSFRQEAVDAIPDLEIRDDDVILAGYSKSGCHWLIEILSMLLSGKTEISNSRTKLIGMIGLASKELMESQASPRILNAHLLYSDLPKAVFKQRNKIIYTVRNPKDTVVSFYHHTVSLVPTYKEGKFNDFYELFMEGNIMNGSYFDHLLKWDEALRNDKDPKHILMMPFEKMKEDTAKCILEIAKFLTVPCSEEFAQKIVEASDIAKLRQRRHEENVPTKHLIRKGQVGGWKDVLSAEQSDAIDQVWKERMTGCIYQPVMD